MLSMQHISKVYRTDLIETHALRDFSVEVGDGEFVAVTGPSGSGKTTFLNIAGMLESFTSGSYMLDGEDVIGKASMTIVAGNLSYCDEHDRRRIRGLDQSLAAITT